MYFSYTYTTTHTRTYEEDTMTTITIHNINIFFNGKGPYGPRICH
jgi:hypothetical protein